MHNFYNSIFHPEEYSLELQNFNIVQTIYLIGLTFLCGVIYICIPNPFYVYVSLIMCFLIIVTIIDANRTGALRKCSCLISVITNVVYLPICFYGFGKLICCVPVYFILGILYTVILVNGRLGAVLSIVETAVMSFVIIFIGSRLPSFYYINPNFVDYIAIIIAVVIVAIIATLCIRTKVMQYDSEFKKMQEAHLKVIDAYNSKDIFFANTSHEIRTPLNAIVGTVNLLLDEELDSQVRDNVYNILNSCNALLAITDELMELSNTENNDVIVSGVKYDLSEMLTEIINMMSVRLMESSVTLYVEIDKELPKFLFGDSGKVRQLFINILNNAVKYTKEGKITLRVKGVPLDDKLDLCVEVEDTGIGIKEEAIPKLFSDYKRDEEDTEKRSIEGTGLGLSLCKDIVTKMGGKISVESKYHVGSIFSFNVPQERIEHVPISTIKDKSNTETIIFERNNELAEALKRVLDSFNIRSVIVSDRMEFENAVLSNNYKYIFIATERYMDNQRFIERKVDNFRIVILSDLSHSVQLNKSCYILTRPVNNINIAMAFNNEISTFSREIIQKGGFTCPDTTIIVVDDNLTNLEVASGLLKKYNATIVTAISGTECINMLDTVHADIIFLDYMMPEMNGIDTLYAIRQLDNVVAKNVPVIALTANVISGAREMFLEAGFSDYISKPIDVNKLENALKNFLPREQLRINH